MTKLDILEIEQKLQSLNETAQVSPRIWGGALEALYERVWSQLQQTINEAWVCTDDSLMKSYIEQEHRYRGILKTLRVQFPELAIWAENNNISLSH